MGLDIGKIIDPIGLFQKDKPAANNTTNITNNYYGNQGPEGQGGQPHHCKHKPPGQGGPEDMMKMFAMLMEMMQQSQGQGQNQQQNGSYAFAQAGTFNSLS